MAIEKRPDSADWLKPDSHVERLLADPGANVPDIVMLRGWIGKSSRAGYWRLYLTPELNEHYEINSADIISGQQIELAHSPLGGSILFVKADAQLQRVSTTSLEAKAAFLQGEFADTALPGASWEDQLGSESSLALEARFTSKWYCKISRVFSCRTHVARCPTNRCTNTTFCSVGIS